MGLHIAVSIVMSSHCELKDLIISEVSKLNRGPCKKYYCNFYRLLFTFWIASIPFTSKGYTAGKCETIFEQNRPVTSILENPRRFVSRNITFSLRDDNLNLRLLNRFSEITETIEKRLLPLQILTPPSFRALVSKEGESEFVGFREMMIFEYIKNHPTQIAPKDWVHEYGHLIFFENIALFNDDMKLFLQNLKFRRTWLGILRFQKAAAQNPEWQEGESLVREGLRKEGFAKYQSALDKNLKFQRLYYRGLAEVPENLELYKKHEFSNTVLDLSTPLQEMISDLLVEIIFKKSGGLEIPGNQAEASFRLFLPQKPTPDEVKQLYMEGSKLLEIPYYNTFEIRREIAIQLQQSHSETEDWEIFNRVFLSSMKFLRKTSEDLKAGTTNFQGVDEFLIRMTNDVLQDISKKSI